ncbi:unnamed protein product [Pleuronectes platessa]|uniref:Uncharacterized protein n=1 Tax=Pleuronectes platessa TaxID=8262 RepID=A0A9N7Z4D3_PLEPL|nr:unnamed protein product [Pleuronectes platessa]
MRMLKVLPRKITRTSAFTAAQCPELLQSRSFLCAEREHEHISDPGGLDSNSSGSLRGRRRDGTLRRKCPRSERGDTCGTRAEAGTSSFCGHLLMGRQLRDRREFLMRNLDNTRRVARRRRKFD